MVPEGCFNPETEAAALQRLENLFHRAKQLNIAR